MNARISRALMLAGALLSAACSREADPVARYAAMADTMLPTLERLSGLKAVAPVQVAVQTPEGVRAYIERRLEQELPPDQIAGMAAAYVMLGLLPESLDLQALLLELYAEQVAGYYDPETKKMYIVQGLASAAELPTILAHELVHALQDQHEDLDSLIAARRGNDRQTAAQAALEGHATLTMLAAITEQLTARTVDPVTLPDPAEQLRPLLETSDQFPVLRRAPRVIREALIFPYVDGARFVQQMWKATPAGEARPAPIGEYLPQSTEHILQPLDRFVGNAFDVPTELRFDDGGEWTTVFENTFGAFETTLFLQEALGTTLVAATGWDGDRYRVLESPAGRALVWVSVWDDEASADRFAQRAVEALRGGRLPRPGRVERFDLEGRPAVRLVVADSAVPPASVPALPVKCVNEQESPVSCLAAAAPAPR